MCTDIEQDQLDLSDFSEGANCSKTVWIRMEEGNYPHCDAHNIPVATNLATAELLIKALERGDLEWREMYKWVSV